MKKILFVGPLPPPLHGESIMLNQTLKIFLDEKFDVQVINTAIGREDNFNNFLKKVNNDLKLILKILFFDSERKTYISISQTKLGLLRDAIIIMIRKVKKDKIIAHLHGNNLKKTIDRSNILYRFIFKMALKKVDLGLTLSEALMFNYLNLPKNLDYINNFVDSSLLISNEEFKQKTSSFSNKSCEITVTFLSNLISEKGYREVFEAVQLYNNLNKDKKIKLKFAGKPISTNTDHYIEMCKKFDWFEYIGIVEGESKKNLLINSHVICLPSYYEIEAQPIVLIEALATGNIIISTDRAAIPNILGDDNFIVEERSAKAILNALEKITNLSPDEYEKTLSTNKSRFLKYYSKDIYEEKIIKFIREI